MFVSSKSGSVHVPLGPIVNQHISSARKRISREAVVASFTPARDSGADRRHQLHAGPVWWRSCSNLLQSPDTQQKVHGERG